jgi:hypothetical protein
LVVFFYYQALPSRKMFAITLFERMTSYDVRGHEFYIT